MADIEQASNPMVNRKPRSRQYCSRVAVCYFDIEKYVAFRYRLMQRAEMAMLRQYGNILRLNMHCKTNADSMQVPD